ncbi:hypothetical protein [Flavobacterium sp. LAR06]|uniref:hypothetical protein n=1 Tax=Flavobacterium sp. LAR06 TaxID=3064897 RepID=UPI0035C25E05
MKKIKKLKKKIVDEDHIIKETFDEIDKVREQKLVNLFIKIIVSSTLKEFYEKGDKISEIQSDWAE